MKYYYPTSSLNFDSIISSLGILPEFLYDGSSVVGFSRYIKSCVDVSRNVITFYSKPVSWNIASQETIDYPMLVEIDDESALMNRGDLWNMPDGLLCLSRTEPYYFSVQNLVAGKVRFLFRNQEERMRLVDRARSNVDECKALNLPETISSRMFGLVDESGDVVSFDAIREMCANRPTMSCDVDAVRKAYIIKERLDGARLGFKAGMWVRTLISERHLVDPLREPLSFELWRMTLSPVFNDLIDMLCADLSFSWDVNRSAVVGFCARCWNNCLVKSQDEQRHKMLQDIARGERDTTFRYPIRDISDDEMQALACFIHAGKRDATLLNLLKTEKVRAPELALVLYGVLVGYSLFSRSLLDVRCYLDDPAKELDTPFDSGQTIVRKTDGRNMIARTEVLLPVKENLGNAKPSAPVALVPEWAKPIYERLLAFLDKTREKKGAKKKAAKLRTSFDVEIGNCASEKELRESLSKHDVWSMRTDAYKEILKPREGKTILSKEPQQCEFQLG